MNATNMRAIFVKLLINAPRVSTLPLSLKDLKLAEYLEINSNTLPHRPIGGTVLLGGQLSQRTPIDLEA